MRGAANVVALLGANGQLGTDLAALFELGDARLVALTHAELELQDHGNVARTMKGLAPNVIINTAAYHRVEACESDPGEAFAVNCIAARNLAMVADQLDACLVHLSTDYVFDGAGNVPLPETTAPNPINVYGASKAAGEFFVRNLCRRHMIIRTSGLYGTAGSSGKGGNFVQTMLRIARERGEVSVVTDQTLSPTHTPDLAGMIWKLVAAKAQGTFHVTNSEECSWFDFAEAVFELARVNAVVRPVTSATVGGLVRRPKYSVLANSRLTDEGFGLLRSWRVALASYLRASSETTGVMAETQTDGARNADN